MQSEVSYKGSFICYVTPLRGRGSLDLLRSVTEKTEGEGCYKVPLGMSREFSGQLFSVMSKHAFSL